MKNDLYVCDRCGEYFGGFVLNGTLCRYGIAKVVFDDRDDLRDVGRNWDLCPACMNEFAEWARGELHGRDL